MSGRPWDEEELALLEELSGKISLDNLAKRLCRSKDAVYTKRQRMGIGGYLKNSDLLSRNTVAQIMGVDGKALLYWERNGLKSQHKGIYWMYGQRELVAFLRDHPDLWNAKKVTDTTIFAGQQWFLDKRKNDPETRYFWDPNKAGEVRYLRQRGYTVPQIAEKTGKTESSIKYLLYTKDRRKKK